METIESAGIFCVDASNGSIMLGLTKQSGATWDWIGGKYEAIDSKGLVDEELIAKATLYREMMEEASLEVANYVHPMIIDHVKILNPKTNKYIYVFVALIEDVATLDELLSRPRIGSPHMGYHWLSRGQLGRAITDGKHNDFNLRGFLKILFGYDEVRKMLSV
jgi:8-oxo-dGTP pyrophosphatase MutT (NUDIX family)